jgi:hypothetical protein
VAISEVIHGKLFHDDFLNESDFIQRQQTFLLPCCSTSLTPKLFLIIPDHQRPSPDLMPIGRELPAQV